MIFNEIWTRLEPETVISYLGPFKIGDSHSILLFPLNCWRWLTRDIIDDSIAPRNFIYNSSGYNVTNFIRDSRLFRSHSRDIHNESRFGFNNLQPYSKNNYGSGSKPIHQLCIMLSKICGITGKKDSRSKSRCNMQRWLQR